MNEYFEKDDPLVKLLTSILDLSESLNSDKSKTNNFDSEDKRNLFNITHGIRNMIDIIRNVEINDMPLSLEPICLNRWTNSKERFEELLYEIGEDSYLTGLLFEHINKDQDLKKLLFSYYGFNKFLDDEDDWED